MRLHYLLGLICPVTIGILGLAINTNLLTKSIFSSPLPPLVVLLASSGSAALNFFILRDNDVSAKWCAFLALSGQCVTVLLIMPATPLAVHFLGYERIFWQAIDWLYYALAGLGIAFFGHCLLTVLAIRSHAKSISLAR